MPTNGKKKTHIPGKNNHMLFRPPSAAWKLPFIFGNCLSFPGKCGGGGWLCWKICWAIARQSYTSAPRGTWTCCCVRCTCQGTRGKPREHREDVQSCGGIRVCSTEHSRKPKYPLQPQSARCGNLQFEVHLSQGPDAHRVT